MSERRYSWEYIFIESKVFVLVDKCPLALQRTLDEEEKDEWRRYKETVDECMGRYYERLQEEYAEEEND